MPVARWGGNRSSRYNWKVNADNAGRDWFFKNGGHKVADPAEGGWAKFVRSHQEVGAAAYLTIPMLGFVAKDHDSYAFSVKKYGRQQAVEMGHPDVGNGLTPDGKPITGNDWHDTSVESSPEFIAEGVRLVVKHAGPGPRYWVLDNEPMLWHDTHRDVRPKPLGYDELWERTVAYAEAIKAADPAAKVAGFCSWGWTDLFYSAADEGGDRYRTKPDHRDHGRVPLAEWFIKKCGEYTKAHGKPLIDVFDFHWYPQAELAGRGPYLGTGMDVHVQPAPAAHDPRPVGPGVRPGVVDQERGRRQVDHGPAAGSRVDRQAQPRDGGVRRRVQLRRRGQHLRGPGPGRRLRHPGPRASGSGVHLDPAGGDAGTRVETVPQLRRRRRPLRQPADPGGERPRRRCGLRGEAVAGRGRDDRRLEQELGRRRVRSSSTCRGFRGRCVSGGSTRTQTAGSWKWRRTPSTSMGRFHLVCRPRPER